jgi:aspartyl-tRNA(Asn)/glutamyl-tRNA(Gln) amidotransferase subunit C
MSKISLSIDEVQKIAKLSQLNLSEDELVKFQGQLSEVLNYVEVLNELDTDKVEPTSQVTGLENIAREDEVKNSLALKEALSGSSETEKEMFSTKAVFKDKNES